MSSAGLGLSRLEWSVVMKLRVGPFGRSRNHGVLAGASAEMFETVDHSSVLYSALYGQICMENDWHLEAGFGHEDHVVSTWRRLQDLLTDAKHGSDLKMSRWWAWEHKAWLLLRRSGGPTALLMVLCWIGWRRGWWTSVQ